MSLQHRFAARVKEIRRRRDLTQQQVAERIDRSVNAVSALERGVSLPSFETLERLADVLEVPVREFFDDEGAEADPVREGLHAALKMSARTLSNSDLALAAGILDLMSKQAREKRPTRRRRD